MMQKVFKVFIGSTREDLAEYRAAVRAAVTELDMLPSGMETWPTQDETAIELCQRKIKEADIYVGIYAYRYGWQPPGYDGKSITELEYDWAEGIPRLCFIIDDSHPWPETKKDRQGKTRLIAFKKRIKEHIAGFFTTPDNLKSRVLASLALTAEKLRKAERPARCNFVPQPEHFAGRQTELDALAAAFKDQTSVAITAIRGIGGIGKTTLAKKFASDVDGFGLKLWAELGQNYREDIEPGVLRNWTGTTFPDGTPLDDMIRQTRQILEARMQSECSEPVLLVMDDVWPGTVDAARRLRDAAPLNARVLLTTRTEDVAARLDCHTTALDHMTDADGAALMLDLISDSRATSVRGDLERLSHVLGGHPLALTLAARQLRRNFQPRRVTEMAEKLDAGIKDGASFRDLNLDTADTKLESVSVSLQQTLDGLGGTDMARKAKRLAQFRALGVLPPDLPFRALHLAVFWIEKEAEINDEYAASLQEAIDDLAAEGLLIADPTREDWYSQHRLLRAYARALLRQAGELDDADERHQKYLVQLAQSVFVKHQGQPETWSELDDDLPQIHALGNELAARLAGTNDEAEQNKRLKAMSDVPDETAVGAVREPPLPTPQDALLATCEDFAAAAHNYVLGRYVAAEGRRWLWAGLTAARARDSQKRVGLFTSSLGSWHNQRGDKRTALAYHEQSLQASIALGDKGGEAVTLNNIGQVWDDLGEKRKALDYYERALLLSQWVGDKGGEATTLNNIGAAWYGLGEKRQALDCFERALPLRQQVGDKGGEAATLNNIGLAWNDLGEKRQALDYFERALPLLQQVGDKGGEAVTLNNIGLAWNDLGEKRQALDYFERALPLRQQVGDKRGEATTLSNIGVVYWQLGDNQKALDYYERALPMLQQVGDIYVEAITRSNMALIFWEQGESDRALEYMQTAHDLNTRIGMSTEKQDRYLKLWRSSDPPSPP